MSSCKNSVESEIKVNDDENLTVTLYIKNL